jgi:phenylpropionate dioxygenase-like ring-hydroxylating dioxygenase large terminal subunit
MCEPRAGRSLRFGTAGRGSLTSVPGLIEQGRLPGRVFGDDTILEWEYERIFGRCWLFLGHESEIPEPGDYVLRRMGRDSVIVVRDDNRKINVLLNHCRHWGATLCSFDQGNTSRFRCPYHGWTYKTTGELIAAPHLKKAYASLNLSEWGLIEATDTIRCRPAMSGNGAMSRICD